MIDVIDEKKISFIKSLLYDYTNDEVQIAISQVDDPNVIYIYAYNYNWDNGFKIPEEILKNNECTLSTALLLFYRAGGEKFLLEKKCSSSLFSWSNFIEKLYNAIMNRKYCVDKIEFKVPLSKVQLYKIKKVLEKRENIFIENIEGINLNIDL